MRDAVELVGPLGKYAHGHPTRSPLVTAVGPALAGPSKTRVTQAGRQPRGRAVPWDSELPLPSLWQLERASKDVMAQNTFPGGQVLVRIQKENLGMLEVSKERQKGDGRWIRCVTWITSQLENICVGPTP